MDSAELGEPTWPDLVSDPQDRDRLGSRFWGLDGLGSSEFLKKACENFEGRNTGVKSLREFRKVYRWENSHNILDSFWSIYNSTLSLTNKKSAHLPYTLSYTLSSTFALTSDLILSLSSTLSIPPYFWSSPANNLLVDLLLQSSSFKNYDVQSFSLQSFWLESLQFLV